MPAHINWPQHTPLTSTLKIAAVYSADMSVCTFNNSRCQNTEGQYFQFTNKTLCYYYHYTPCIPFHIISTYQYASVDTIRLHLIADTRSKWNLKIEPFNVPHLKLYKTTNKLSVSGKNGLNMQYMNNRRSRWQTGDIPLQVPSVRMYGKLELWYDCWAPSEMSVPCTGMSCS